MKAEMKSMCLKTLFICFVFLLYYFIAFGLSTFLEEHFPEIKQLLQDFLS